MRDEEEGYRCDLPVFPVDKRRGAELEALGCRVVDRLEDDWRGEFMVLMRGDIG